MLKLDVRVGDSVDIDSGRVVVHVEKKHGQQTRLAFEAGTDIKIRMVESSPSGVTRRRLPPND